MKCCEVKIFLLGIRYSLFFVEIQSYINSRVASIIKHKESAMILQSKMQEICKLIPGLAREIVWDTRGTLAKTSQSKDEVTYSFRNGSTIKNVSMTSGSRGFRAQAVLTEEVATITDQQKYEEIIAPMLVISRKVNGKVDPDETLNQNDIYVTSAGFKGTYAYDKLIDALCRMVSSNGYDSFILGGDWRVKILVLA